jgi:hypothetical protein
MEDGKFTTREFSKGLNQDAHSSQQPDGTVPFALNVINKDNKQVQFKSNEHSHKKVIEFPAKIAGKVHQDEYNRTFYLLRDGSIYYQDHDTETKHFVAKDTEFNCKWEISDCERVDIVVYTKNSDTYLQWSSKWTYYVVNISEMLSAGRKAGLKKELTTLECKTCNRNCNYFKVFKPKCPPKLTANPTQTGGSLTSGAYFFSVRQLNRDGSKTTWSTPTTNPAFIYSETNITGEQANGRIELLISNLNCNYEQIEVAIIYQSSSATTVDLYGPTFFTGTNYTYTHISNAQTSPISLQEILIVDSQNYEGRYQSLYNNKMYYYGIRPYKEYNVQKIANGIRTRFFAEKYTLDIAEKYQIKSLPRGEAVSFGLWLNEEDGNQTYAGIIPCTPVNGSTQSGSQSSQNSGSPGSSGSSGTSEEEIENSSIPNAVPAPSVVISFSTAPELLRYRGRNRRVDNVQEPDHHDDLLLDIHEALVTSYNTEVKELVDVLGTDCCEAGAAPIVDKDIETAEEIGVKWASLLSDLISDGSKPDLIKLFTPSTIKDVTLDIIRAVSNREDIYITPATYSVFKENDYENPVQPLGAYPGGDPNSSPDSNPDLSTSNPITTYPGGEFAGYYDPICSPEKDTKYPCVVDCEGNPIFGVNAGKQVFNPRVPDESIIPTYKSHSIGVRSEATPDADEYSDGYIYAVGVEFSGINIDFDDYYRVTGRRLCPETPYTIGMVKLSDHNKTILTKGVTFGGYKSSNQNKNYIYQNLAGNSFEKCDRYIDKGEKVRMDPGAEPATSSFLYGLDQSAIEPFIGSAELLTHYKLLSGTGFRHNLYAEGVLPQNKFLGKRVDITGAVQTINLNKQFDIINSNVIGGIKYVKPDSVAAPPTGGGNLPLMNRHQQGCLWIANSGVYSLRDRSFVGDVLDHAAPITDTQGYYSVVSRRLDNQYGPVENRSYIPKIIGKGTTVRGLIGNRFISPYSFVKTSWVSDKVGDKFQISSMLPGKSDRCICDSPEDAINKSKYIWTQHPKSGDVADAKNWCGLHTVGGANGTLSRKWVDAVNQNITESDMFYPGGLTTMFTIWGEWETNPWGVELSSELPKQRYNKINPVYELGSQINGKKDWTNGYLDQMHIKRKQASTAERTLKILIDMIIPMIVSLFKLESLIGADGALDLTGNIASVPIYIGMIAIFSKVLFTEDFIYELIGLPKCRQQSEGGIDFNLEGFFINWNRYSSVFNREMDIVARPQLITITGCNFDDLNHTTNKIAISDRQVETSIVNGYTVVKPMSHITLTNDVGDLKDMFTLNGKLYGHTTDGIFLLNESQQDRTADVLQIINGVEDQLYPVLIIGSNPEGLAGIKSKTHTSTTQIGKVFIDYDGDTIYNFTGSDLKPISLNGLYAFFKNHIKYCETTGCIDVHTNEYYALGYDPVIQRIMITKGNGKYSWTVSYDPHKGETGEWVSFHSYFPKDYLTTRSTYYHLTDNEVWIHDPRNHDGTYGNFFGKQYPTIWDVKHTFPRSVQYTSHFIGSDVEIHNKEKILYNRDITFDEIAFWNDRQSGGKHKLDAQKVKNQNSQISKLVDRYTTIPAVKERSHWKVNELFDYTANTETELIKYENECSFYYEPVNYTITDALVKQNNNSRRLSATWYITRLIWNNTKKFTKIYLKYLTLNAEFKNE